MKKLIVILILLICFSLFTETVIYTMRSIAVIPIQTMGVDEITKQVTEIVLFQEIEDQPSLRLITPKLTKEVLQNDVCSNADEARIIGTELKADLVLISSLNKLGEKILVQFLLVDVKSGDIILADNLVSLNIEDLDMVMKRLAICVDKGLSFDETSEIGNITLIEEEEPRRRKARYYGGGSFGYLFPTAGFKDDFEKSFIFDLRSGYELDDSEVGFLIGLRHGFVSNVYYSRLLSKKDFCPFIGGSFGFHWITHNKSTLNVTDGFEAALRTGFQAYRTYDFHILVNFEYTISLNETPDQSLIFSLGLQSNYK